MSALLDAGFGVLAQDTRFAGPSAWNAFAATRSGLGPVSEAEPEAIVARVIVLTHRLAELRGFESRFGDFRRRLITQMLDDG